MNNIDNNEIEKFGSYKEKWWNPQGELKTLHDINPIRLNFILEHTKLSNQTVVDIGCGGGILSEALAKSGANVLGIDMAKPSLEVATKHAQENNIDIQYRCIAAEDLAAEQPASFDSVVCMELLEHVPNPESIIASCAKLVKPQGTVFFSTLNRNLSSYLQAIIAAEYVLRMIPRGTHNFNKFITPAELIRMCRHHNLEAIALNGMKYRPLQQDYVLTQDTSVNYLLCCRKK